MIYAVKLIEEKTFMHPCGYQWGNRPKGEITEIPENEFWFWMNQYSCDFIAYNQISGKDLKDFPNRKVQFCLSGKIYYFNDFCLIAEWSEGKMQFWKIAICLHNWEEVSGRSLGKPQWNCYHYYVCSKCKKQKEEDSLD